MHTPQKQTPQATAVTLAADNTQRLDAAAAGLRQLPSPSSQTLSPSAAYARVASQLAAGGVSLPALLPRNVELVLQRLAWFQDRLDNNKQVGQVVICFDNCCAAHKNTGRLDTYTAEGGDSYSSGVMKVRGHWQWGRGSGKACGPLPVFAPLSIARGPRALLFFRLALQHPTPTS